MWLDLYAVYLNNCVAMYPQQLTAGMEWTLASMLSGLKVVDNISHSLPLSFSLSSSLPFPLSPPNFSYSKDVPAADRLSQVNNSELLVIRPNTGLMYRDAIAQLKNISTELSHCASSQLCPARIVSLSIPSPFDFTLTGARYENITRKCNYSLHLLLVSQLFIQE